MANEIGMLDQHAGNYIIWTNKGIKTIRVGLLNRTPLDSWNGLHCLDVDRFIENDSGAFGMFLGEYDNGIIDSYWQPLQYDDVNPQFKLALSMMGAKYDESTAR